MADPLENKDSLAERFGSRSPRHGESAKPFESALDVANRALFTYPLEPLFPKPEIQEFHPRRRWDCGRGFSSLCYPFRRFAYDRLRGLGYRSPHPRALRLEPGPVWDQWRPLLLPLPPAYDHLLNSYPQFGRPGYTGWRPTRGRGRPGEDKRIKFEPAQNWRGQIRNRLLDGDPSTARQRDRAAVRPFS
jgi:hypothetical protein